MTARQSEVDAVTVEFLMRRYGPHARQGARRLLARGSLSTDDRELYDWCWNLGPYAVPRWTKLGPA